MVRTTRALLGWLGRELALLRVRSPPLGRGLGIDGLIDEVPSRLRVRAPWDDAGIAFPAASDQRHHDRD